MLALLLFAHGCADNLSLGFSGAFHDEFVSASCSHLFRDNKRSETQEQNDHYFFHVNQFEN